MSNRKNILKLYSIAVGFLLITMLLHIPLLSNDAVAVKGDGFSYLMNRNFMVSTIKNGEFPLWNSHSSIGIPYFADVQNSVLGIFNILYVFFDVPLAFGLTHAAQMFVASYSMYLLLEEYQKKTIVSVAVGLIYGTSIMMGGARIEHHTIGYTIAFFPTIMYCITKFQKEENEKWLALSSVFMAIQFLGGFTQICLYFDIFIFGYMLFILAAQKNSWKINLLTLIKWVVSYLLLISVQLFPLIHLMVESERNKVAWGFFSVLAYDLRILFMMLCPNIYMNSNQAFDEYHSSGIDIEIYIGIICLVYIVHELSFHYRDTLTKRFLLLGGAAFLFGMVPHIPILGKLVYHLPVIGGFRVCARSVFLFLFTALILFGLGLSRMRDSDERKKARKINHCFLIVLIIIFICITCVFSQQELINEGYLLAYRKRCILSIAIGILLLLLNEVVLLMLDRDKRIWTGVVLALCLVVIGDTARYSFAWYKNIDNFQNRVSDGLTENVQAYFDDDKENLYRSFVLLKDSEDTMNDHLKVGLLQRSLYYNWDMYNNYLTFMDKKLDYWGLKETLIYPAMLDKLNFNNDVISMLGIHYILAANNSSVDDSLSNGKVSDKELLNVSNVSLINTDEFSYYIQPINWLENNSVYEINLEWDTDVSPELLYADFYTSNWDKAELDGVFKPAGSGKLFKAYIETGSIPENEQIYMRVITDVTVNASITRLSVNKLVKADNSSYIRHEINSNEDVSIIENTNANKLLYVPQKVLSLNSYGENWNVSGMKNVNKNSYIEGFNKHLDLINAHTDVEVLERKQNSISAKVETDENSFLNFSQLYYPGWKAYIDGRESHCYIVNNLIMGTEIPAGEHIVEFKFSPNDVKVGAVISTIGIIFVFMWANAKLSLKILKVKP